MPSRELFSHRQERSRYVAISVRLLFRGFPPCKCCENINNAQRFFIAGFLTIVQKSVVRGTSTAGRRCAHA